MFKKLIILVFFILIFLTELLFSDTTYVSGNVSGVWEATGSPYIVTGEIHVTTDLSLRIMPGCSIIFQGHYKFCVDSNAVLKAIGTETDSIVFTAQDTHLTDSTGGHLGIRLYHAAEGCTLSYCLIEYGNATNYEIDDHGGGIYFEYSDPVIINNTISRNQALYGMAIYCNASNPVISYNLISDNNDYDTEVSGGVISCGNSNPLISNNIITRNTDNWGGCAGIFCSGSNATIIDNVIFNNVSYGYGGGIICGHSHRSTISGNVIQGNSANWGGGMWFIECDRIIIYNNKIIDNSAYDGGGMYLKRSSCWVSNNLLSGNNAELSGGGIFLDGSYDVLVNNTITGNTADEGGGICCRWSAEPYIVNCIIWDNDATIGDDIFMDYEYGELLFPCSLFIAYSNVVPDRCFLEGGSGITWGPGNIDGDPLFNDPDSGDYGLQLSSPCINAGDSLSRLDEDSTRNDMGAYGGKGEFVPGTLGGEISGSLEGSISPYIVVEDIIVTSSLSIRGGVVLKFHNRSGLRIFGHLHANSTLRDSIIFTKYEDYDKINGIEFINSSPYSQLSDCRIMHSKRQIGGAVYCFGSSPLISWCNIQLNSTSTDGGGICCVDNSNPVIQSCIISQNRALSSGGGVFCGDNSNADIFNNNIIANVSGGIYCYQSSPLISSNFISENTTEGDGGGIYCYQSKSIITDNIISNNFSSGSYTQVGGGIACDESRVLISKNIISGNLSDCGGGIGCELWDNSLIVNNVIFDNNARNRGGGFSGRNTSLSLLVNNTFSKNNALRGGGIYSRGHATLVSFNNIFWNDSASTADEIYFDEWRGETCTLFIAHTNIDPGKCLYDSSAGIIIWGPGNIDSNPLFGSDGYILQAGSPCIDAGAGSVYVSLWDTIIYAPNEDKTSILRPLDLNCDIGAYEYFDYSQHTMVYEGWNLLSIQRGSPNQTVTLLFPDAAFSGWGYLPEYGSYYEEDTLDIGKGYWILIFTDYIVTIPGTTFSTYSDTLLPGWNLIGALSFPVSTDILDDIPGVLTPVFEYSPLLMRYEISDVLLPGRGYWILATDTVEFTMSAEE